MKNIAFLLHQEKMASSSGSWCAACTFLLTVHKVFEASNVAEMLNDLAAQDQKDALAYGVNTRLKDRLSASVASISVLQQQIRQIQNEILYVRNELSNYIGPAAASSLLHPHNSGGGGGGGGGGVGGGTPFGIPSTLVAKPHTQMLLPHNQQQALHNQNFAAAISNNEQQEIWNSMFSMDGGGAGSSVMAVVHALFNPMSMMGGMPSSSNNQFGARPAESDHQNPQVSPAATGASSVDHHHLSLQQQILQQQLYLQQQQGKVSPAAAGASSVHHHHLSLQQQQQQGGQEPALHLKDAGDDKHSVGPSS